MVLSQQERREREAGGARTRRHLEGTAVRADRLGGLIQTLARRATKRPRRIEQHGIGQQRFGLLQMLQSAGAIAEQQRQVGVA